MSFDISNLDWLRTVKIPNDPNFGQRLYQMFKDVQRNGNVLEQQTNSDCSGYPGPPPKPDAINVIPHPQGVDVSIQHEGEFYQGIRYHVDYADNPQFNGARTHDLGQSRNGVIPLGKWNGYYQVRALYPNGKSSIPVVFGGPTPKIVNGGSVSRVALLPTQAAGTTRPGQPPGFGAAFRSATGAPPVRSKSS
jgi:hypothetical protein